MAKNQLYNLAKDTFKNICYGGGVLIVAGCFYLSQDGSQMSRDNGKFMNNLETKIVEIVNYEGKMSNNQPIQTASMIPMYSTRDTDKNENVYSYKSDPSYKERKVASDESNNMVVYRNNIESF